MVKITQLATEHLLRLRDERGKDGQSPRFVASRSRLRLTFAQRPEPADQVVEQDGLAVYVAADVAPSLERKVIDARVEGGKSHLVLRRLT